MISRTQTIERLNIKNDLNWNYLSRKTHEFLALFRAFPPWHQIDSPPAPPARSLRAGSNKGLK